MTLDVQQDWCLVTGCAGFVGSHLCEALLAKGCGVIGVDNYFSGFRENMDTFFDHEKFVFYETSVIQPNLLKKLKQAHPGLQHVFHLAAIVSTQYSVAHGEETMRVNCVASIDLHNQALELGFKQFVFAGSAAEYGDIDELPIREESVALKEREQGLENLQISPYGRAKYLVSRYIEANGFGCSLRFFNIYGPRQDPHNPYTGVISRFISLALQHSALTIEGNGLQSRDFIHITDVVSAYCLAAWSDGPALAGVYNIGSNKQTTVLEIADMVNKLTGNTSPHRFLPPRKGDIKHSLASLEKFSRATGFNPLVPLSSGLQNTIEWIRNGSGILPEKKS